MLPATTASVACLTVLLLAFCSVDARLDVFSIPSRARRTCSADRQSPRIEDRALCPFTRTVDLRNDRIPASVPTARCNCHGRPCSRDGDFRCQEVREDIRVAYVEDGGATVFRNETFTVACACITSRTRQAVSDRLTRVANPTGDDTKYGKVRGRWRKYSVRPYNKQGVRFLDVLAEDPELAAAPQLEVQGSTEP
ncbi:hypothetical protein HPB50_003428 [Hyalomma asiaticum]|uniref:Uncharacterized protein n=1 Tax=Hyalomma asiaticum TaxID=266040 RepID=A0ACB7RHY1_HYAAI|nr:hypothetical protein HPB50_003428 [Hyalomma asiaticum]